MWSKKFGYIFKNSLAYLFKHFAEVSVLFFVTAILLGILNAINFLLKEYMAHPFRSNGVWVTRYDRQHTHDFCSASTLSCGLEKHYFGGKS